MDDSGIEGTAERTASVTFLKELEPLPCRPQPKALCTPNELLVLGRNGFGGNVVDVLVEADDILQACSVGSKAKLASVAMAFTIARKPWIG